jgi:hypothetical protein
MTVVSWINQTTGEARERSMSQPKPARSVKSANAREQDDDAAFWSLLLWEGLGSVIRV